MAKKGKKIGAHNYDFKYREEFKRLMKKDSQVETRTIAGFKLKNINQLWRWDNLADIK